MKTIDWQSPYSYGAETMEKFLEKFNQEYDFLYNADVNNQYVVGSNEALVYFDNNLTEVEQNVLREFVRFRGDFVSSDREAIAFMFTLDSFI